MTQVQVIGNDSSTIDNRIDSRPIDIANDSRTIDIKNDSRRPASKIILIASRFVEKARAREFFLSQPVDIISCLRHDS